MTDKIPIVCDLILLEKCNVRCKMCYMWKYASSNQLTFQECKTILDDLKGLVDGNEFEVNLSGGEPLLRKDIFDLIRVCSDNGFSSSMATNAFFLDEEMVKKLSDSGLNKIVLSLASLNEETHDFLRGVKGSYARLMNAIGYLEKYWHKREIYINAIIKNKNLDDIVNLAEWVEKSDLIGGVGFQAIAQPFFLPCDDLWYEKEEYADLWPRDKDKVNSVLDRLIDFKSRNYKIGNSLPQLKLFKDYYCNPQELIRKSQCNFGDYIINVNPIGEVMLCSYMRAVGNIRDDSVVNILNSEAAATTRERMHNCKLNCNNIINCWFRSRNEF